MAFYIKDLHTITELSKVQCDDFGECFNVCCYHFSHKSPVNFSVIGLPKTKNIRINYIKPDDSVLKSNNITQSRTTENAAYVVAFFIVHSEGYKVIEQASKGDYVDYWISKEEYNYPFEKSNKNVGLEVSGILQGQDKIKARIAIKKEQVDKRKVKVPCYIIVSEFSNPTSNVIIV